MRGIGLRTAALALGMLAGLASPAWAQQGAPATPAPVPHATPHATPKAAQKATDKPLWRNLTPAQQTALGPLAGEWDKMEGVRKQKWLDIANRFSSMTPDEQARVHERMREWVKLTPEQRRVVRENYTRSKQLDPGKKSEQWEQYQQLPEEQKKKLAAAAAARKKQVANLPPKAQPKTVAPVRHGAAPAAAPPPAANPAPAAPNAK